MSIANDRIEMLLVVALTNLEDNPELLNILKCYFESIPDISKITTVEQYPYTNIIAKYVFIYNKPLASTLYTFNDIFDNYIKVYSVFFAFMDKDKSSTYYIFNSYFNGTKIVINKKDLKQYIKDT